ncbi:hypothetical protein RS9916_36197 [Synechococcus sp. RS9916]|nr:hypothetical protein RS9916_36197 [Synechococcus sp. RS9916]
MQCASQGEGLVAIGGGRDRRVQVHKPSMAGQLWPSRTAGVEAFVLQMVCDRLHHQFMLTSVLIGLQQGLAAIALSSGASQGIATQLATAQAQQTFG